MEGKGVRGTCCVRAASAGLRQLGTTVQHLEVEGEAEPRQQGEPELKVLVLGEVPVQAPRRVLFFQSSTSTSSSQASERSMQSRPVLYFSSIPNFNFKFSFITHLEHLERTSKNSRGDDHDGRGGWRDAERV